MSPAAGQSRSSRVALVGTGEFGRDQVRVYREIEGAELAGIYHRNSKWAR
jgi:predicted homoserine dehydrogenase-like protein